MHILFMYFYDRIFMFHKILDKQVFLGYHETYLKTLMVKIHFRQILPEFSHELAGNVREMFPRWQLKKGEQYMRPKMRFVSWKSRHFRQPLRHYFSNRKVKDRLFCYIFEHDRKALLQLYNTLNHSDYQDEEALQVVTLENVVYMSMNNDLAFLLTDTLNLYEHQSTVCPNIPLRFLLYIAAEYESLVEKAGENIYGSKLIRLPAPQCVVFYNGSAKMDDEQLLRLTDAFTDPQGTMHHSCLELTVRMLNINHGHNKRIMKDCRRLEEYALFVSKVKEFCLAGESADDAIDGAVLYCIDHNIMEDIFMPFRVNVKKSLLTEYDEKKVMKMFKKEAQEEGRAEGRAAGLQEGQRQLIDAMLKNGVSVEEVSRMTDLTVEKVTELRTYRH